MSYTASCATCGGTNVQVVDWTRPNAGDHGELVRDGEPYSASADMGETWCEDCEDNTEIVWAATPCA